MFLINGSIQCSEIDYETNSFYVRHNFGFAKSASKSFTFELNGLITQFRPAYVTFRNNEIKVSLGTYRFNSGGIIRYSFVAYNKEDEKVAGFSPNLYFNISIIQSSVLFARMNIRGITPGDVFIQSDIPFSTIQGNKTPKFFWDKPSKNADASNSDSSSVVYKEIVGYYYAFNSNPTYFITRLDQYIRESSNSDSTHVYVTFPSSGSYYFHIRAINSAGNISRNTSHAEVIYNVPPTKPTLLSINNKAYYNGPSNINVFSWNESSNSDNDDIKYEIAIYKDGNLYYNDYINAMRSLNCELYGKTDVIQYGSVLHGVFEILGGMEPQNNFGYHFFDNISKERPQDRLYFIYNRDVSKNISGSYYYTVRGYDWAEQSQWSDICYYDIDKVFVDLYSKAWIGYPDNDKNLSGRFFIYGDKVFLGFLYIIPSLFGKTNICDISFSGFYGNLVFKEFLDLFGSLEIETNFSDIFGKLFISCVPYSSDVSGRLRIVIDGDSSVFGKMLFRNPYDGGFYGDVFIIANGSGGFCGLLETIRERMSGKMSIIRNFSNNSTFDSKGRFFAKMNIDNYPPEPIVNSDIGHDWQDSNIINFSWTILPSRVNVVAFEYTITKTRITDFSSASFYRTTRTEVTVNLFNYDDDGMYYFYVRSIAENGSVSSAAEYVVRYNNKPSTPSFPMYVNNSECIDNIPIISRSEYNEFKWPKSTHTDRDIVKYQIQISGNSTFSDIIVDINEITDITESDFASVSIKYNYSDTFKILYWRVRAYDIYQFTEYGYVGRFRCNTKPGIPTNLRVENEV